jgi:hypothetical protein
MLKNRVFTSDHKIAFSTAQHLGVEETLCLCLGEGGFKIAVECILDVRFGELRVCSRWSHGRELCPGFDAGEIKRGPS